MNIKNDLKETLPTKSCCVDAQFHPEDKKSAYSFAVGTWLLACFG